MEVVTVLHMNGGSGDSSYSTNSLLQKKVLLMTKKITEEAIANVFKALSPESLSIADLGCSSGPNTLLVALQLIRTIEETCKKMGKESPEYQIHLNDLFGNDFNAIFKSLPRFQEKLRTEMGPKFGPCLFNGVPGSFYDRLFPANTIHFVHSSYSLHFLSQVPDGVENNKGNICVGSTSPANVSRAYYQQFAEDFGKFLKLRYTELVSGGHMVLTMLGRKCDDPRSKQNSSYIWELLAIALNEMTSQGIISEEALHSFNIPFYSPSPKELASLISETDGLFTIDHLEASELAWSATVAAVGGDSNKYLQTDHHHPYECAPKDPGYDVAMCIRAVAEPMLVSHFGPDMIDEVFYRFREIVSDCLSKQMANFVNVTVAITKTN